MFDCQIREQKPQGKGQNGHFLELPRPKLAQASIWLAWAMGKLQPEATRSPGRADTFKLKQPVCLGELPLHQMVFSINSHAWGRV